MTCIGNSGPLDEPIVEAIEKVSGLMPGQVSLGDVGIYSDVCVHVCVCVYTCRDLCHLFIRSYFLFTAHLYTYLL